MRNKNNKLLDGVKEKNDLVHNIIDELETLYVNLNELGYFENEDKIRYFTWKQVSIGYGEYCKIIDNRKIGLLKRIFISDISDFGIINNIVINQDERLFELIKNTNEYIAMKIETIKGTIRDYKSRLREARDETKQFTSILSLLRY
jgi:hypothetical protein